MEVDLTTETPEKAKKLPRRRSKRKSRMDEDTLRWVATAIGKLQKLGLVVGEEMSEAVRKQLQWELAHAPDPSAAMLLMHAISSERGMTEFVRATHRMCQRLGKVEDGKAQTDDQRRVLGVLDRLVQENPLLAGSPHGNARRAPRVKPLNGA